MSALLNIFSKHGLAGLVILALFFLVFSKSNGETEQHKMWHDDIKANTQAVINLTERLTDVCEK